MSHQEHLSPTSALFSRDNRRKAAKRREHAVFVERFRKARRRRTAAPRLATKSVKPSPLPSRGSPRWKRS